MGREVEENVKRKLYAESMGKCMNPACANKLFRQNGDIIEKAHIDPYCETADNSFENLVVLCPNCHTDLDKNHIFTPEEVLNWKHIRQQELNDFFAVKFSSFDDLKQKVAPLLCENKTIYEKYYLSNNKKLWDKFIPRIVSNNRKLKTLLQNNLKLFQKHRYEEYSNLELVNVFLLHIDEFELTRCDEMKNREVLFPAKINSIFGIAPVNESLLPMTERLEELITKLDEQEKYGGIFLGIDEPYFILINNDECDKIFLNDTPRLRQLFFNYRCYRETEVRFQSLNFALKYIKSRYIDFEFSYYNNLREITISGVKMVFVYEYCLSEAELLILSPKENSVVVNLHNWNGKGCISNEARIFAQTLNIKLQTMDEFYVYINRIDD